MARQLKAFARQERGSTAIEFALLAPVLLTFFLGIFEVGDRLRVDNVLARVALQTADLVAQEQDITTAELNDIREAARLSLRLTEAQAALLTMEVASIGFDANTGAASVRWRNSSGQLGALDPAVANGLGERGDSVIWTRVTYQYTSPVGFFISGPVTMAEAAFARPRLARRISLNGGSL
ncbi:MAG: pilus assembly protein [Hyphomonadaceae bacterium]|nr:pilus assembly protein [Hyphomonadaceae bacterium]